MIGRSRPEILRDYWRETLKPRLQTQLQSQIESQQARLQELSQKIIEQAPGVIEEVRSIVRNPRLLANWLESRSPWLGRRMLGAASSIVEPFTLGMGLEVERLTEDTVEVAMSGGWKNRGESGAVHSAALSALGEFAVRLFWEHHLDLRSAEVEATRVQVRILSRAEGQMKGVFRLPEADREAILHRLRAEGSAAVDVVTMIYDRAGRLVAEVDSEWRLQRQLSLSSGPVLRN